MTDEQFMSKWRGDILVGWWQEDPDRLFWARSYKMPPEQLLQMSHDFLAISGNEVNDPKRSSSSLSLARHTVKTVSAS